MVVSMFVMQRMTPQAGMDPQQQRMMNWMMPLMMGFLFFNFAAGLSLYYAETNLIGIAQQAIMNRTRLGREMREMMQSAPARKRNSCQLSAIKRSQLGAYKTSVTIKIYPVNPCALCG